MKYYLTCQTRSKVKVHYAVANGPIYNLLEDKAKSCIREVREDKSRRKDLSDVLLSKDEHICLSGNIREEGLALVRTGTNSYKVVDDSYLKKHKPKSKRSVIEGDDLVRLFAQLNRYGNGCFRKDRIAKTKK